MRDFEKYGVDLRGRTGGQMKTFCPRCRDERRHKSDRSLSVNIEQGLCHCHNCGASFVVPDDSEQDTDRKLPVKVPQTAAALQPAGQGRPYVRPLLIEGNLQLTKEVTDYFGRRGISPETLQALKVGTQYEYMGGASARRCISFHYFVEGELVNVKYRALDEKAFKMVAGAELVPYNLDSVKGSSYCAIVEGEVDALSLHEVGCTAVVSVPAGGNGGTSWMDRFMQSHFADKRIFYIATDTDEVGQKMADELQERLGEVRCLRVRFSPDCKDANEELTRHGRESLLGCLRRSRMLPVEDVVTASDLEQPLMDIYEHGLPRGADTGLANLDALCNFELGRLMVLTGRPGDGKSEFLDELVTLLGIRHGWKTLFFSPENVPVQLHVCKLIERITGRKFRKENGLGMEQMQRTMKWLSRNIFHICTDQKPHTLDNVLDIAAKMVVRRGINILVIDPLNRLERRNISEEAERQYLSDLLTSLSRFAQQTRCLVVLVAHPRKVNRTQDGKLRRVEMNDISGSADFGNKCDYCLVVERVPCASGGDLTRVYVEKVRFKHHGKRGVCVFLYDLISGRFQPCKEVPGPDGGPDVRDVDFDTGEWELPS